MSSFFASRKNLPAQGTNKCDINKQANSKTRMSQVDNQIKVTKVQNPENIPTNFSKSDFRNYLGGWWRREFYCWEKGKNQQSWRPSWEKSPLSHLNRVCVCALYAFIIFLSGKKKLTSWPWVVQISLCGGSPGLRWEKTAAHPNTDANCTV